MKKKTSRERGRMLRRRLRQRRVTLLKRRRGSRDSYGRITTPKLTRRTFTLNHAAKPVRPK
jgi:hypothetical protein